MKITFVIGSYNRKGYLQLAIDSIRQEIADFNLQAEIIVVDGGSTDGSAEWLIQQKDIITILQYNRGTWKGQEIERRSWGYFMNLGFRCSQGKYICMLSDDCLVIPGAIRNGVDLFEQKLISQEKVGGVAFYWRNWPDMKDYMVGTTLGDKVFINHGLYLRKALEEVDYINENDYHFYNADGDLCLKLWQKDYAIIPAEDSYIEHFAHANAAVKKSNQAMRDVDWNTYLKKWENIFHKPGSEFYGRWIMKKFVDKAKTVKQFQSIGN